MIEVYRTITIDDDNTGHVYDIDVTISMWRESFGEDADGNRGISVLDFDFNIDQIKRTDTQQTIKTDDISEEVVERLDTWIWNHASDIYNS